MTYKNHLPLNAWAEEDRPREKLLLQGRRALSDAELLAILLGSGSKEETAVRLAQRILSASGNNLRDFAKQSSADLTKFKGIGEAKAVTIVAAMELGRRWQMKEVISKMVIKASSQVYELMYPHLAELVVEEFWLLMLNRGNRLNSKAVISKGGMTGTVVDSRVVYKLALEKQATSIILCHNHPSGNPNPSDEDIAITRQLKKAGELFNIAILDHVIVTESGYFSFADEGKL